MTNIGNFLGVIFSFILVGTVLAVVGSFIGLIVGLIAFLLNAVWAVTVLETCAIILISCFPLASLCGGIMLS